MSLPNEPTNTGSIQAEDVAIDEGTVVVAPPSREAERRLPGEEGLMEDSTASCANTSNQRTSTSVFGEISLFRDFFVAAFSDGYYGVSITDRTYRRIIAQLGAQTPIISLVAAFQRLHVADQANTSFQPPTVPLTNATLRPSYQLPYRTEPLTQFAATI